MIITLFIGIVFWIISVFFMFLPEVTISSIPIIGDELTSILVTMVTTWNAFIETFPYAGIAWNVFLFVIIPFEILMIVGKFLFGHRMPSHNVN